MEIESVRRMLVPSTDEAADIPLVRNFVRRAFHASVAVGNFIYVDGGEVLKLPMVNGSLTGRIRK